MTLQLNGHNFETKATALTRQVFMDGEPTSLVWQFNERRFPDESKEREFLERAAKYLLDNADKPAPAA